MTTYGTNNPLGSISPKDLFDNAENLDKAVNSQTVDTWSDRFGKQRKTWSGIEKQARIDIDAAAAQATVQAEGFRDEAREARDDAVAAAGAIGPIKFYGTYAQAMGDAANWPTDGLIEIARDETRDGARTRYRPNGAALDFVVNLDQLRIDLITGNADVGIRARGAKSVLRTVSDKFSEFPLVTDYLYITDLDHTDAFIRAASENKVVMVAAGEYRIRPFECEPCLFVGDGQGSVRIIASGLHDMEYTISFLPTLDENRSFGFEGVSFIAADDGSENDGVIFPAAPGMYDAHVKNVMRNVSFCGSEKVAGAVGFAQKFGWRTNFILGDGVSHDVDMIEAYGTYRVENNPIGQPASKLMKLRAHTAMVSARITRIATYNIREFAEIGDNAGWFFDQIDQAYGERGIYSTGTRQLGEGIVGTGVLNVQRDGVNLSSLGNTLPYGEYRWCRILDISVNRIPSGFDGAWDWIGVRLSNIKQAWIGSLRTDCNGDAWPNATSVKGLSCTGVEGLTATNLKLASRSDIPIELIDCPGFLIDNVEFLSQTNNFATFSGAITSGRFGQWTAPGGAVSGANRWKFEKGATQADLDIFRLHDRPVGALPARELQKVGAAVNSGRWVQTVSASGVLEDLAISDDGLSFNTFRSVRRSGVSVSEVIYTTPLMGLVADDTYTRMIRAQADNVYSVGNASRRYSTAFIASGAINTSDGREKTSPLVISDDILDAWGDIHLVCFKWLDSIQKKGEIAARLHFGVIAQQVRDAFLARGLDGTQYGLLCYDEWDACDEEWGHDPAEYNDSGEEVSPEKMVLLREATPAGNRWGIRADQCLFLEAAWQRRENRRMQERLKRLEDAAGLQPLIQ